MAYERKVLKGKIESVIDSRFRENHVAVKLDTNPKFYMQEKGRFTIPNKGSVVELEVVGGFFTDLKLITLAYSDTIEFDGGDEI